MTDRIRISPALEAGIHQFALRNGRSFENAARHLLTRALATERSSAAAQAPELKTINDVVGAIERLGADGRLLAADLGRHARDAADPELREFLRKLGATINSTARTINEAVAARSERRVA